MRRSSSKYRYKNQFFIPGGVAGGGGTSSSSYSSQRSSLLKVIFVFLLVVVIGYIFCSNFLFFSNRNSSTSDAGKHNFIPQRLGSSHFNKIAIVIPFVGKTQESVPTYLDLFCTAAAGSASLVDFLIIHNNVIPDHYGQSCPANVKFISLNIDTFSENLLKVLDKVDDDEIAMESRAVVKEALSKHVTHNPYGLVEFKPALGHVFSQYLQGYSHWGYSDLDIVFGDLSRWITTEELNEFDIVTFGFGDQYRVYLRGQFTIHKNVDRINQLWRQCDYLSRLDQRFAKIFQGEEKFHFESAEGCYSAVILDQYDIKVKYAVKAFTDVHEKDTAYTHGIYIGTGKKRDKTVVYKAGMGPEDGKALTKLSETWFEMKDTVYNDKKQQIQSDVGNREPVSLPKDVNNNKSEKEVRCMYWVQQKYQSRLCIEDIDESYSLFWIHGRLYKQKYETIAFPSNIQTAPFFHFQEWKRSYRASQLVAFERTSQARTFVLNKEGVIPLYNTDYYRDIAYPSHLGFPPYKWKGLKNDDRQQLPKFTYCLKAGGKSHSPVPASKCKLLTSWQDKQTVEIISRAPNWKHVDAKTDVTLAITLQITAEQATNPQAINGLLEILALYLNRWQGQPCVLVIHVAGVTHQAMSTLQVRLGLGSDLSFGLDSCLVGAIFTESKDTLSRKALLNMAMDASPTRFVLSGFELERGIIISEDTAFFAHRTARIYKELQGNIFIIPQFGFVQEKSLYTISDVFTAHSKDELKEPAKFEEGFCEGDDEGRFWSWFC